MAWVCYAQPQGYIMKDASIIVGASMDYMKGWIITTLLEL